MVQLPVQQQQGQVVAFPSTQPTSYGNPPLGQTITPTTTGSSLFPSFPMVAAVADRYAKRAPWYFWGLLGAFLMFKLVTRGRR